MVNFIKKNPILFACICAGGIMFSPSARAAISDDITDLSAASASIETVYTAVAPAAIASTALGCGMIIIKRVAFS